MSEMLMTSGRPRIAYRVEGAGAPVLLVMGLGMRGEVWKPQIEGLRDRYEVAIFDNRGVGESEGAEGRPWSIRDMAEDALAVADALGWAQFHLVGVSMGGMIAQEVALLAPARVWTLALIATHAGGRGTWAPTVEGMRCFARANIATSPRARARALSALLYPAAYREACDPAAFEGRLMLQFAMPAPARVRIMQLQAVLRHRAARRLRKLRVPTLVVRPGVDCLIRPKHSDRLARLIPGARLLRLDDAGHGVVYQCAERVNDALHRHFGAASASPMAA